MTIDLAVIGTFIALALSTLNLLGLIRNMFTSGERKLDERLTRLEVETEERVARLKVEADGKVGKVETKLIEHDRRIQTAENEIKHLPDRDMAHKLEIGMERIAGRLDAMDERLRPIAQTNHRLQEFLLEQAQK